MPELPDVEIQKRYFDATSLRHTIVKVQLLEPRIFKGADPKALTGGLPGKHFSASRRHGKYLFAGADPGLWVVFHFGMDGFLVFSQGGVPPARNSRATIFFEKGQWLSYNSWRMLGGIRVTEAPAQYLREAGIGPDALDPGMNFTRFRKLLAGRRSPVKAVLMDQHVLAGIGNLYADEILFQARMHPSTRIDALEDERLKALYHAIRTVLQRAISYQADIRKFPKRFLLPHRHPKGRCPICGAPLEIMKQSGRTGYYCPQHQKIIRKSDNK